MPRVVLIVFVELALGIAVGLVPALARAQGQEQGAGVARDFYAGVALAIGIEQFDLEEKFSSHDEATGVDLWAGYRVSRVLAIEAEFIYLTGFDASLGGSSVQFNSLNFTANLKLHPFAGLSESVRPYLVSGVGGGRFETESSPAEDPAKGHVKGGVFRFGGGVDFNFGTPVDFVAGVDYLLTSGLGGSDLIQIKLGFQHAF